MSSSFDTARPPYIDIETDLGIIRNKSDIKDVQGLPVAADTILIRGMLVLKNDAAGVRPPSGNGKIRSGDVGFIEADSANKDLRSSGYLNTGRKGNKFVQVFGKGTIICTKALVAIPATTGRLKYVESTEAAGLLHGPVYGSHSDGEETGRFPSSDSRATLGPMLAADTEEGTHLANYLGRRGEAGYVGHEDLTGDYATIAAADGYVAHGSGQKSNAKPGDLIWVELI